MKSLTDCLLGSGLSGIEVEFLTKELENKIKSIRALKDYKLTDPLNNAVVSAISPVIKDYTSRVLAKQADIYKQIARYDIPIEAVGSVYIDRLGRKPFVNPREIKRGKKKGKIEIRLTEGRDENGRIRIGKKKIVDKSAIKKWPKATEVKHAKKTGRKTEKTGRKNGAEGEKGGPVRLRNAEKNRVETKKKVPVAAEGVKSKKQISAEKYDFFVKSLTDKERELVGDTIIDSPENPARALFDLKKKLREAKEN